MPTPSEPRLWRHGDFLKLWAGQTISQVGSQVTFLALPLVAVLTLEATPFEMGLLTAAEAVPSLLAGLHAGAIVDRRRRRPILIGGDLGRASLLALVPLAWALGALSMPLLYVIALAIGLLGLFFDVAYQAFLPSIVARERLVEGNAKLELSRTAAEVTGPGLAGGLVQLLTAPVALLLDACSYVASGLLIAWIKTAEPAPDRAARATRLLSEIREGVGVVLGDPRLRALVGGRGIVAFFNAMLEAVFVLYVARSLGVGPALLGAIFAVGGAGFVIGALLPERAARRIGVGPALAGGVALVGLSDLLVPLADGSRWVVVPLLTAAQFFFGIGLTVFNINQVSLRQAIVPGRLLGRAGGTTRVVTSALVPLGALLGGLLGEALGLRETLTLAAIGELLAALWLWRSPLRSLRHLPAAPIEDAAPTTA
jgi:MFS family permease